MRYQERMEKYDSLEKKIKNRYKKAKIRYKNDYVFWRILPKKLKTSGFTFWNTIWMPKRSYNFTMLAHEYAHLHRMKKMGFLKFLFLYLFPQIIALPFAIITIIFLLLSLGNYAFIPAIGLLALLPWPSKHRLKLEAEGYIVNLAVGKWIKNENIERLQKFIVDSLVGWLYYKMTWERKEATKLVEEMTQQINERPWELMANEVYKDIYRTLNDTQT
jgi:hypothetical protein